MEDASSEKDLDKKEKLYRQIVTQFPTQEPSSLAMALASGFAGKGEKQRMLEYFVKAKARGSRQVYHNLALELSRSNPKEAEPMLKNVLDSLEATLPKSQADDPASYERRGPQNTYYSLSAAFIQTLLANNKKEDAYKLAKELNDRTGGKHPGVASAYLTSLVANGQFKEAYPLIANAVGSGYKTSELRLLAKEVYTAIHGKSNGFDEYFSKLENERMATVMKTVAKKAINKPSVDFTLKDLDGKPVTLSELKGKVVVIDFWATWCVPCKASFPAMQKAVTKYKDDPQVKFLFIHTWEQEETATEDAKKYIQDSKYSFQVLMDLEDPETKKNKVVSSFSIEGLPTKVIVDPKGNVLFQVVGFNSVGGDESQVEELSAMIEYARK
jgi:thiol-disulfide isomerase/thioredoxin